MVTPGVYHFGSDSGTMLVRTYRTGLGSRAGHDLVIEVTSWRAVATVGADPAASTVSLTADVDSFEVREGRGGIKPLTDGDRADIRATIREKVLDTARHPVIEFASTAVHGSAPQVTVDGQLTVRGATRPITVAGTIDESPEGSSIRVSARVVQSEYGVKPYSAFLGALKLRDDVDVDVEARLVPAS